MHRLRNTKQWSFASAFVQNSHSALFLCLTLIDHETATLLFFLCLFLLILELECVPLKPSLSVSPESEFPGDFFPIKDLVTQCCAFLHATAGFFWIPAQLPYEQAQLTCWKKRDHVGQRKLSGTGDPGAASSQATCFLEMREQIQ